MVRIKQDKLEKVWQL